MRGTARERTRLSWRRTALAVSVVALLAVRLSVHTGRNWAAALAVPGWLVVLVVARRRSPAGALDQPAWELPVVAGAVAGFALLGTALVVLP